MMGADDRIERGRILHQRYGDRLAQYQIQWSKRWNYEGWMLIGIENAKVWIEDEQAELFILGLLHKAGVRRT